MASHQERGHVRLVLEIPGQLRSKFQMACAGNGRSMRWVLSRFIEGYIKRATAEDAEEFDNENDEEA